MQRQKHELKTVIATGYVSGNEEEEDNIKENAELVQVQNICLLINLSIVGCIVG